MIEPNPALTSSHLLLKDTGFDSALEVVFLLFLVKLTICHNDVTTHVLYLYQLRLVEMAEVYG